MALIYIGETSVFDTNLKFFVFRFDVMKLISKYDLYQLQELKESMDQNDLLELKLNQMTLKNVRNYMNSFNDKLRKLFCSIISYSFCQIDFF